MCEFVNLFKSVEGNWMLFIYTCRYPKGGTRCGRALNYARSYLFRRSGRRKKVLIVMTDGISHDRVYHPARRLKRMGVKIFALGIGRKYNRKQLNQIASGRGSVFTSGFRAMRLVVGRIQRAACRAAGNCYLKCVVSAYLSVLRNCG